jgi:hypothetical protein
MAIGLRPMRKQVARSFVRPLEAEFSAWEPMSWQDSAMRKPGMPMRRRDAATHSSKDWSSNRSHHDRLTRFSLVAIT